MLEFCLIFSIFSPIFLHNIFHDVICLVNTDSMFTLNHANIEDIQF